MLFLPVLLFCAAAAGAAPPLQGELWVFRDLLEIMSPGDNRRETGAFSNREQAALEELLEDARWIISGMIYGYSFQWTPLSRAREVEEELLIRPLGLIPRGDPRLTISAVVEENGFLYVQLAYSPDEAQQARLRAWQSEAFPAASGKGSSSLFQGASRRKALEAAIRETVRAWLREREFNKPREVSGRVALTDFPVTGLTAGGIEASVRLRMMLKAPRHYSPEESSFRPL